MILGNNIRYLRKKQGWSQDYLAEKLGYKSYTTIQKWESGVSEPPLKKVHEISNIFHVDIDELTSKDLETPEGSKSTGLLLPDGAYPYNPTHRIPILGRISAGMPLYAEENIEGYIYTELNHGAEYFALRVKGDSMNAVHILDGQVLVVRKQDIVENGEIAVVLVGDDEATVKRFYQNDDIVTLEPQSLNPEHRVQTYNLKKVNVRVVGKVMQSVISY